MRLKVHIRTIGEKTSFLVFEDIHKENEGIIGQGWALKDAVDDFLEEFHKSAFYDDETPVVISRDEVEIEKVKIISRIM
jgi:hypothetical protein